VLASASPRREALLRQIGLAFAVRAAGIDEQAISGATPQEITVEVAVAKARAVHRPGQITIGADTAVVLDGQILGKPQTSDEATATLRRLRGRWHCVLTAIAILADGHQHVDLVSTKVQMRDYSDEEIAAYVASGDPFDKAGAYAVQHERFRPVARVRGCYQSVVGLPLCHLARLLQAEGVDVPAPPPSLCCRDLGRACPAALFAQTGD
jgi:MAF protein